MPTPDYLFLNKNNWENSFNKTSTPCVVKPNNLGSSLGISIVKRKKGLQNAIKKAFIQNQLKRME
ncbi:hypothetical protein CL633_02695 [bacterium]|nr:hypothetical protein [bacterium]